MAAVDKQRRNGRRGIVEQEGVTMNRLTEWIGEGEDRHATKEEEIEDE